MSCVESARDVFQENIHRGYVRCLVLLGPCQDMPADMAGRFVEDPCAGVAGCLV